MSATATPGKLLVSPRDGLGIIYAKSMFGASEGH
jgi:hypothetical protein